MIAGEEADAAPAAAPSSPDRESDSDEESVEEPTGLYLVDEATAAICIKDATLAATAAWYARACQLKKASEVARRLRLLDEDFWAAPNQAKIQAKRFRKKYGVKVWCRGQDILDDVEGLITNEFEVLPLHLAVSAAELDAAAFLEETAREQAGLSETDELTSLLTSAFALLAAPRALQTNYDSGSDKTGRVDALLAHVRAAGVSISCVGNVAEELGSAISALKARLAREPASVRAAAAWERAKARLPRGNAAANALLADAISAASLEHPETLEPQDDDDVAVFVPWDDEDAHREALDEWRSWTLEEPSSLASVGRNRPGLRFDYRVDADGLVAPTAESYPRRPSGAPTVVQPASALALPESLHGLVDGVVLGVRRTAWMRSEASS